MIVLRREGTAVAEKICATVPTRGDHPDLLANLVSNSQLPLENFIIVRTSECAVPAGVSVVDSFETLNIQTWWNAGIHSAELAGADFIAVLNDDMAIGSGTIQRMVEEARATGATIVTSGISPRVFKSRFPVQRVLDGAIWLLDLKSDLRPDERFQWYFGDDDLDIRARRDHHGVSVIPLEYEHLHVGIRTNQSAELAGLTMGDRAEFRRLHPLPYYGRLTNRHFRKIGRPFKRIYMRMKEAISD